MFIEFNSNTINQYLDQLEDTTQPLWGEMTVKQMIVHLEDTLKISNKVNTFKVITPEDKLPLFVGFLNSDKEMPRGYKVDYFDVNPIETPINEIIESHNQELDKFLAEKENPNYKATHPIYGELNFDLWVKLHQKHYTHHFKQFGLI